MPLKIFMGETCQFEYTSKKYGRMPDEKTVPGYSLKGRSRLPGNRSCAGAARILFGIIIVCDKNWTMEALII